MIRRVNILVEGQTEETFVNTVLGPWLTSRELFLKAILVTTKPLGSRSQQERGQPGRQFKGGIAKYEAVKRDVVNTLRDKNLTAVSTMIDYYRLPSDFPGMANLTGATCYDRVHHLEAAFSTDITDYRFRPFFMLHEYEALLFSEPHEIVATLEASTSAGRRLTAVRQQFNSPEEIDDGPTTHPAARILDEFKGYRKAVDGALIAGRIGIERMRHECPHFAQWLSWLESL